MGAWPTGSVVPVLQEVEDKRTAMAYAKDFQDAKVLVDLIPLCPGDGGTLEFRDLAASQVWAGVQLATERLGGGRTATRGGGPRLG